MTDVEIIHSVVNAGQGFIFLYLFWVAWKRMEEMEDDKVSQFYDCMDRLDKLRQELSQRPTLSEYDTKPLDDLPF